MPFRELACSFPPRDADPQAGRYPGGYPFWPAGARRRAIVGVASERLHQERGRPSADRNACSDGTLGDKEFRSPAPAFELQPNVCLHAMPALRRNHDLPVLSQTMSAIRQRQGRSLWPTCLWRVPDIRYIVFEAIAPYRSKACHELSCDSRRALWGHNPGLPFSKMNSAPMAESDQNYRSSSMSGAFMPRRSAYSINASSMTAVIERRSVVASC